MRVALVTCRQLPEPDPDEELLLHALAAAGLAAELLAWDDPAGRPEGFDLCVLRSCWNYHHDPPAFLAWIERAERASRLLNPAPLVRWNLHKRYLAELAARGVPCVPTVFVERGRPPSFAATLEREGWSEAVVKPAISAASFRTRRFRAQDAAGAQAFLAQLAEEREAMIQRFLPAVLDGGEKALVWIAGEWTHAVRKSARFAGAVEHVSEALPLSAAERALAERVLAGREQGLLYARLDLIPADDGAPLVSELELIEPSLYLAQHPPALARLARAIRAVAGAPSAGRT